MKYLLLGLLAQITFSTPVPKRNHHGLPELRLPKVIDETMYLKIEKFAQYTAASGSACGKGPTGSTIIKYLNIAETETQAALFRNDEDQEFVLAMPGSATAMDYKLDEMFQKVLFESPGFDPKECNHCHVHQGFLKAWTSLAAPSAEAIKTAMADYPHYQVSLTGHSLGAALASLATAGLHAQGIKIRRTITFGEPRVGGPHYANHIDKLAGADEKNAGTYHRVTHGNDVVPQQPGRSAGYQHSRTEYWERDDQVTEKRKFTVRCFGQESADCNDGTTPSPMSQDAHMYYGGLRMASLSFACAK